MSDPKTPDLADEFAAALQWWRMAGVDHDYDDVATSWLAEPQMQEPDGSGETAAPLVPPADKKAVSAPIKASLGGDRASWPSDLATFHHWWLTEPSLDSGGSFPRISPIGKVGAKLMIIVSEPEEQDRDKLLSGPRGIFLGNVLAAMNIKADEVYLAAALPRHMPLPDWDELQATGLGDVLHHHIALAAPEKICAFGRNIWPLFGHDLTQPSANLPNINHDSRSVPILGAEGLAELLRSAPRRERFWQRWLEWTGN